ncbi:MAG: hypothetical protein MUE42_09110 [Opitutaceae bacterium]|jgi:hypothetical protein|nr:hypothetical protein [Opitutaceae bacterium]
MPHTPHVFAKRPIPSPWFLLLAPLVFAVLSVGAGAQGLEQLHSYASWPSGWRQNTQLASTRVLAIEATRYDLALNLADFTQSRFAARNASYPGYLAAFARNPRDLLDLPVAALGLTLTEGGRVWTATTCIAGEATGPLALKEAWLWESGRYVQHYELHGLKFTQSGSTLASASSLRVVAWPDTLTLTLSVTPASSLPAGAKLRVDFAGVGVAEQSFPTAWPAGETRLVRLNYQPGGNRANLPVTITAAMNGTAQTTAFSAEKNCLVTSIINPTRSFPITYQPLRQNDLITLTVNNAGTTPLLVPYLLDLRRPASITGLVPVLYDAQQMPTGVPIQLSKNWHYPAMTNYLMGYAYLPAPPGQTQYTIRVVYGFFGTVPSASHAQLSLVGYDKAANGRWEQLAIGAWGETTCFDLDMSAVDVAVTDIRLLTARAGPGARRWDWTTAGWGGDWLDLSIGGFTPKLTFGRIKTSYVAHGPCLTEVHYKGAYGDGLVLLDARVRTLRTNDFARTFQRLRYQFNNDTDIVAANVVFYRLGSRGDFVTPRFVYGHAEDRTAEFHVPVNTALGAKVVDRQNFTATGPWWVYLPDADSVLSSTSTALFRQRGRATDGDRGFVVRSYSATFDGVPYTTPTLTAQNFRPVLDGKGANINALLVPPPGVTHIRKNDVVEFEVELITLPRAAEDYYGDNDAFRQRLRDHPSGWQNVQRAAKDNALQVSATGGDVLETYPVVVRATAPVVEVTITGGMGFVPLRFEGLSPATGWSLFRVQNGVETPLNQAELGNDYWQVDPTGQSGVFNLVFNVPLDGIPQSTWRLRR